MSHLSESPLRSAIVSQDSASTEGVRIADRVALSRSPSRERTLEIHCDNCQARFVWYGTEEDADTETVDVEKCGLCAGDSFKKDVFKDTVIRLIAQVTARNVMRE